MPSSHEISVIQQIGSFRIVHSLNEEHVELKDTRTL